MDNKQNMEKIKPNEVLNKYFEMRDNTHVVHLQTDSYSQHKTLNKFYDNIVDLADEFAEQYQGITGERIANVGNIKMYEGVKIDTYLKDCKGVIEKYHSECELITVKLVLESTLTLINSTLYLLKLN